MKYVVRVSIILLYSFSISCFLEIRVITNESVKFKRPLIFYFHSKVWISVTIAKTLPECNDKDCLLSSDPAFPPKVRSRPWAGYTYPCLRTTRFGLTTFDFKEDKLQSSTCPLRGTYLCQYSMFTLFSTMPLYHLWPFSHYNMKKGWMQGHIWGGRDGYRGIFRGKSRI